MLFTSLEFLLFLPAAVLVFHLLPGPARLPWLLAASALFYGSFGAGHLGWFLLTAGIALVAARRLARPDAAGRRAVFWAAVAAILGLMGLLKYYGPLARGTVWLPDLELAAPAGFSFYAFTAIALLADRYRAPADSRAVAGEDLLFLAWFPKILAGPIERISPFRRMLRRRRPLRLVTVIAASQLILWGLVKKVVVADNLAPFVDRTYAIAPYAVPMELVLASYFFAFQIYCDFSGYTDMARGASRLFGIRLSENFRRPYFARSVGEFWSRRWHLTLSAWFRDYLYEPLIGDRSSRIRVYFGLMTVFVVSGAWHAGLGYGIGSGFLVWGALNGLFVWIERAAKPLREGMRKRLGGGVLAKVYAVVAVLMVFHLVLLTWVFFRAGSTGEGLLILGRIWAALPELPALLSTYPFRAEHGFLVALVAALTAIEAVQESPALARRAAALPQALRWLGWLGLIFALLLLGRWQGAAFVYMQF